jgi:hypothetical protein
MSQWKEFFTSSPTRTQHEAVVYQMVTLGATNSLNVNAGRSMRLVNGVSINFGTLNNFGTIQNGNDRVVSGFFSDFINRGTFNNAGTFNNNPGARFTNLGMFTNSGTINGGFGNSGGAATNRQFGHLKRRLRSKYRKHRTQRDTKRRRLHRRRHSQRRRHDQHERRR